MNIAILNASANVGKTIIGKYVLQPRMDSDYISVTTPVKDKADNEHNKIIPADDFKFIQNAVLSDDNIIVDVSSSHTATFLRQMAMYQGSHEDYAYFIVPVIPDVKAISETRLTLEQLIKLGISPSKIRLVFNKILSQNHSIEQIELTELKALATEYSIQMPSTPLYFNEVFPSLEKYDLDFFKVLEDEMGNTSPSGSHATLLQANEIHQLAESAQSNMDAVFADLALVE